jgi:phosphoglycolate phosphatase
MGADLSILKGATLAFDLDGTLVDTAPDLVGAVNTVLAEEGLPTLPFEQLRLMIGRGARTLIARGFAAAGAPLDDGKMGLVFERFIAVYLGRIARESLPYPGCLAALDRLSEAGAILAVCTNKRTDLSIALLDALNMTDRFAAIIGADIAPAAKPDARHLIYAVERAGGDLTRSLLVGDSENDVRAARAAGAPSVFVTFGYCEHHVDELRPDTVISDYAALPDACARLLRTSADLRP